MVGVKGSLGAWHTTDLPHFRTGFPRRLVSISAFGGFVLLFSAVLLIGVLIASHRAPAAAIAPLRFSLALYPPRRLPASLNSFGIWALLVLALTVANYGYPLAQFVFLHRTAVPAFQVSAE